MTTAENEIDLQENDPMATQSLSLSLPPYPKMIMDAIEASNDPNGCNKTAIAKHIESTQIPLPPSHNTLLNYHLNHMKQLGHLVIFKNNYMKPNPNGPPKRGRGRPPKPKPELDPSHAPPVPAPSASPPRPRGRPPKSKILNHQSLNRRHPVVREGHADDHRRSRRRNQRLLRPKHQRLSLKVSVEAVEGLLK